MTQMQQHSSSSSPAAGGASKSSHTLEQPPSLAHASSAGLPHGHHEHKSHHHDKPHGVDRHHKHAGEKDEKKHTKDDSETPESPAAGVPVLPLGDLAHAEDDHAPSSYRTVSHLKVHEMPLLGSRPSTPSGGHSAQPIPVEAIYRHYAGSDSEQSRLGPKGLKVLAEDVFDEFCVRYKKKLQEVTHPKDGSEYTEGQCETDLWTDLPFLLPCHPHGHTTPTREEYVTYIAKVCQREMKRSAAAAPDHSVSGSSHGHSASQLRITRTEFLTGWRHCAALLVAEMERVKDSEAKESPCKLM